MQISRAQDAEVLVTIDDPLDLDGLAKLGRRLNGSAQAKLTSDADVFLADATSAYLGRICHYRECHPRVLCHARHCGAIPHLADDLDVVTLPAQLIAAPPLELFPDIVVRTSLPADAERIRLDMADSTAGRRDT